MTEATIQALDGIRDLSMVKWYVIPLLMIVMYIYAKEIKAARTSGNWNAVFAGLTLFGVDFSMKHGTAGSCTSPSGRPSGPHPAIPRFGSSWWAGTLKSSSCSSWRALSIITPFRRAPRKKSWAFRKNGSGRSAFRHLPCLLNAFSISAGTWSGNIRSGSFPSRESGLFSSSATSTSSAPSFW